MIARAVLCMHALVCRVQVGVVLCHISAALRLSSPETAWECASEHVLQHIGHMITFGTLFAKTYVRAVTVSSFDIREERMTELRWQCLLCVGGEGVKLRIV